MPIGIEYNNGDVFGDKEGNFFVLQAIAPMKNMWMMLTCPQQPVYKQTHMKVMQDIHGVCIFSPERMVQLIQENELKKLDYKITLVGGS